MATKLLYLDSFDVKVCTATIQTVDVMDDERIQVTLDQTCFYPRGGGQDWDTGTIRAQDAVLKVEEVRLDPEGIVQHIGALESGDLQSGAAVECRVDGPRRDINTRLHSAGHVVDMAVQKLGYGWRPGRGAHYPHMSFVEYSGELAPEQYDDVRAAIQSEVDNIVAEGGDSEIRFMPVEQMHTVCAYVPENIPTNKPARVVIYNGTFGCPCGGTHVSNIRQIGKVTISKLKSKKGVIKVSYAAAGIN